TGMLMAISVLGALYEKKATGKGRRLQLAMQDSGMQYIRTSFAVRNQQGNKQAAPRMGAQSTSGAPAPCGVYPTRPFGYNDYVYIFCSRANPEQRRHRGAAAREGSRLVKWRKPCVRSQGGAEMRRPLFFGRMSLRGAERQSNLNGMSLYWHEIASLRSQ